MATRAPKPATKGRAPTDVVDSQGRVRIYADIPKTIATELAVLALRRNKAKKDLLADIIAEAVRAA